MAAWGLTVVDLSARHGEVQRAAFAVDNRVNFCGAPAAADPDSLLFLPPFAPLAARWAFTIVRSIDTDYRAILMPASPGSR
jgi:hypothetical protein